MEVAVQTTVSTPAQAEGKVSGLVRSASTISNARGKQRSRFFMTASAAYECAHGAALMTETECDLLTDKTRGANDEIHR